MPSCSARVFMCVSMRVCVCVMFCNSMCVCVSILSACLFVSTLFFMCMCFIVWLVLKNVFMGMYTRVYKPARVCACATEHTQLWICMCARIYCWGQCYLVRCFPHYFSGKWAISHIAWSLIVSLCKSIQELQLKCSLMWYNWCLPNPLFAHLPVSLNF